MSKKKKQTSSVARAMRAAQKRGFGYQPPAVDVGAAMRAANARGDYSAAIRRASERALGAAFAQANAPAFARSPKTPLTALEKAARKAVREALRKSNPARAARLPGKSSKSSKSKSKGKSKPASSTTPAKTARQNGKKVPTVTAQQVIAKAANESMKRWLCEGARRSGCGAKGRVTAGKGSFVRIRPPRFMTAGG